MSGLTIGNSHDGFWVNTKETSASCSTNWGNLPAKRLERERVLMQLKRIPAQIVCLAEAQELVEETLRSPPSTRGAESAVADELEGRGEFEYLVIRGREDSSLLMAVRTNMARSLECLHWERRFEGTNKKKRIATAAAWLPKSSLTKASVFGE